MFLETILGAMPFLLMKFRILQLRAPKHVEEFSKRWGKANSDGIRSLILEFGGRGMGARKV